VVSISGHTLDTQQITSSPTDVKVREDGYKYLGVLETDQIKRLWMMEHNNKTSRNRFQRILPKFCKQLFVRLY